MEAVADLGFWSSVHMTEHKARAREVWHVGDMSSRKMFNFRPSETVFGVVLGVKQQ